MQAIKFLNVFRYFQVIRFIVIGKCAIAFEQDTFLNLNNSIDIRFLSKSKMKEAGQRIEL